MRVNRVPALRKASTSTSPDGDKVKIRNIQPAASTASPVKAAKRTRAVEYTASRSGCRADVVLLLRMDTTSGTSDADNTPPINNS